MIMTAKSVINASLVFRDANQLRHMILLPGNEVNFGRDHLNDIQLALFPQQEMVFQLATADISRQHFIIRREEQGYVILDLGSTNGTSVDCVAILKKPRVLKDQEVIDIGGVLDLQVTLRGKILQLQRMTNTPQEAYVLFTGEVTIGSAPDNCIVVTNADVMPYHAKIQYQSKLYTIAPVDQQSKIKVNDTELQPTDTQALCDQSHIWFGTTEILFRLQ